MTPEMIAAISGVLTAIGVVIAQFAVLIRAIRKTNTSVDRNARMLSANTTLTNRVHQVVNGQRAAMTSHINALETALRENGLPIPEKEGF